MYLTTGGENWSHKNAVQLQKEYVYRKGQADPDNQRPDKRSSTVFWTKYTVLWRTEQ